MFPNYTKLDRESLRDTCRKRSLNTYGNLHDLVTRLVEDDVANHVFDTAAYTNVNDPTGQKRKDQEMARRDLQVHQEEHQGYLAIQTVNTMRQAAQGALNQAKVNLEKKELAVKKAKRDQATKVMKLHTSYEEALKRINENLGPAARGRINLNSGESAVTVGEQDAQVDQRPAGSKGDQAIQQLQPGLASGSLHGPRKSNPKQPLQEKIVDSEPTTQPKSMKKITDKEDLESDKIKKSPVYTKDLVHLFIGAESVPVRGDFIQPMKTLCKKFGAVNVRADSQGYYIFFKADREGDFGAVRCMEVINGTMFEGRVVKVTHFMMGGVSLSYDDLKTTLES